MWPSVSCRAIRLSSMMFELIPKKKNLHYKATKGPFTDPAKGYTVELLALEIGGC